MSRSASCTSSRHPDRAARPAVRACAQLALALALLPAALGAGEPPVNGCLFEDAVNWLELGPGQREMGFGCPPFPCRYTPPCVKIKPGRTVRWLGTFSSHPLRAGLVIDGSGENQANNPIPDIDSGTNSGLVSFPDSGTWGFYCNFHFLSDEMKGAVFVALFADGFETGNTGEWSSES